MRGIRAVEPATPVLLEFRGPDAVRFLNGQLTQDVRRVVGQGISLPSCVTDAKGKMQFRVTLTESADGALWIDCPAEQAEGLEARLTRYLIADDVEVVDLTGMFVRLHLIDPVAAAPQGVLVRKGSRFGTEGVDWWIPTGMDCPLPEGTVVLTGDELEALRIANGIPTWGCELKEGMLPPEALLDSTDISYIKGCYIGQEVISRIKSAGKVNRRLTRFQVDGDAAVVPGPLENGAGEITSISPFAENGIRQALGYVKRGATNLIYETADGTRITVRVT